MEPLSREDRDTMMKNGRGVTEAEIDEYEQLLVQRHWGSANAETALRHVGSDAEKRINELYQKLYDKQAG